MVTCNLLVASTFRHVNFLENSEVSNEKEFLFSAYSSFVVEDIAWSASPTDWTTPHRITIRACPDNALEAEDVPSAPWA